MPEVVARGLRFHVQRLGPPAGRLAVFLHGLVMDNLSSWYFTVGTRVARTRPVLLYDLRGHGRSERPEQGYGLDDMVADLVAVLDEVAGGGPVDVVGNSFGGTLALAFAAAHPERVASLALVDAHVGAAGWGDQMAATLELEGDDAVEAITRNFQSWLGRHRARKRNRLARTARALVYGTSLVRDLRGAPDLPPADLARIEARSLLLYGEDSDALDQGRGLAERLPHAELVVFPGCTHSVLWEATGAVRDRLLAWLAG